MPPIEQLGPFSYRWEEGCFPLGQDSLLLGSFAISIQSFVSDWIGKLVPIIV